MSYPPPPSVPHANPSAGRPRLRGRTPRRLGWAFLALAVVLVVVGVFIVGKKAIDSAKDYRRVPVAAGGGTVTLDRTGKWVVYYEAADAKDLTTIPIAVTITAPDGSPVNVTNYGDRSDNTSTKLTYEYDGTEGASTYQFDAPTKGVYKVVVRSDGSTPSGAEVAIGEDIVNDTVIGGGIIGGIGVLFGIAAIVLLIVGYVKRGRHKRELAAGHGYGYGGPPPGYGYPQQGGYPGGYPQGGWQQGPSQDDGA